MIIKQSIQFSLIQFASFLQIKWTFIVLPIYYSTPKDHLIFEAP